MEDEKDSRDQQDPEEEQQQTPAKQEEEKPDPKAAGSDKGDLTDKHGQEAISKGRYDRDMQSKDDAIADLKKQIEDSAKTEEGRKALEGKITKLEGQQAEMREEYELKLAGCKDDKALKAAKALMSDYDGDVSKLKSECPYLFNDEKQTGSTGKKPIGSAGSDIDAKLDKAFGIK